VIAGVTTWGCAIAAWMAHATSGFGRPGGRRAVEPRRYRRNILIHRRDSIRPVLALLRLLADCNVAHVRSLRDLDDLGPIVSRLAVQRQRRFERVLIVGLFEDREEYTAAELRAEELAKPDLNRDVDRKPAVLGTLLPACRRPPASGVGVPDGRIPRSIGLPELASTCRSLMRPAAPPHTRHPREHLLGRAGYSCRRPSARGCLRRGPRMILIHERLVPVELRHTRVVAGRRRMCRCDNGQDAAGVGQRAPRRSWLRLRTDSAIRVPTYRAPHQGYRAAGPTRGSCTRTSPVPPRLKACVLVSVG
jgi:hypothetical protein